MGAEGPGEARLLLVDGSSLFHRAFFALPPLTSPRGEPTGAVFGFLSMLARLAEDERPTHWAVAFDRPEPTYRHREFTGYKAQRPEMPAELRSQVPLLARALEALRVPVVAWAGAEADDVLATLATRAAAEGFRVRVVTGDRDALQLVGGPVEVLYTRRGITDLERVDAAWVRERYGVPPERLVDVKALMGDPSDNIPGVPTVGEKTACRLVAAFGGVEELLARLPEVGPPRVQAALREHRDLVLRNARLCRLMRDLPLPWDPEALRVVPPDAPRALELFAEMGSRALAQRFGLEPSEDGAVPAAGPGASAVEEVPWTRGEPPAALAGPVAVAYEALGPREVGEVAVVAVDPEGRPHEGFLVGEGLRAALPKGAGWLTYDSKPLCHLLLSQGRPWRTPLFDGILAAYLLEPDRSGYPLDDVCRQVGVAPPGPDLRARALAVARLWRPLTEAVEQNGLARVYREIELPLVEVLADMERAGVLVDRAALEALAAEFARRLREVEADVYAAVGEPFNLNSTQQLAHVLFERLGLRAPKRTKTGYSTDAEVLEELAAEHPLPGKVLLYRTLQKLQSTYVEGLAQWIGPDGRIHTTYQQTVAVTGRLASQNPNLQNIPVRDEIGRPLRRVFVAPEGWQLVSADYSQVELRILAHLAGDEGLIEAFRSGADIHRRTAAEVWGVPPDRVTDAMRAAAKAINFGIVYGISDYGLARQLGVGTQEAHDIIARYFARYPGVKRYLDRVVEEARQRGVVRTLYGRLRRVPDIGSRNRARRAFAERTAMNSPVQGTAADLIKLAMIRAHRALRERGLRARLLLQVHDELVFEAPEDEVPVVAALAREAMEGAGALSVPLSADVQVGPNWLDMVEVPRERPA